MLIKQGINVLFVEVIELTGKLGGECYLTCVQQSGQIDVSYLETNIRRLFK